MNQEMSQEVATLRPNQYTSNNTIRKSQKLLNYPANYHLKTQQQEKNEEELKSPETGKLEFRETTWRKPRMPYNKFPDAFQMRQKGKSIDKITPDDYDKLVKQRQYQQVKKYLNPISLEKRPQKIKNQNDNGNPLSSLMRYFQMQKKISKEFIEGDNLEQVRKSKPLSLKKSTNSQIRINQCITLGTVKPRNVTGTIKKMLHVPTLTLVCVREQPTNTRQSRNSIKQWVNFWQTKLNLQNEPNPFVKILSVAYNYPQGAISIVTEYLQEGSLLNLMQAILTLPESAIREIFQQVFNSLKLFYQLTQMQFGGLSPSQILITNQGTIKLGMGLYYHFNNSTSSYIYHIKTPQKTNIFEMNMTQKNFMKSSITQPANLEAQRTLDIFKIGLIILESSIGGFQNFQQSSHLHQIIKIAFTQEGQKIVERDNVCCLIHSQSYLLDWANRQQKLKKQEIDQSKVILYMKLLKDRFSNQFLSFLCSCLKLQHTKRANLSQILTHSFLCSQVKDSRTVNLTLKDLLLIGAAQPNPIIESTKEQHLDKFIGHVLQVLSNCRKEEVIFLLKTSKEKILEIGKTIGINNYRLGQKLYDAIGMLAKSMKNE